MIKKIITYPNPVLKKKAVPIATFDDELKRVIHDMMETMFDAPGAGLAAPQIGLSRQLVIINTSEQEEDADKKAIALINPLITAGEGAETEKEGCLSVIDYSAKVKRFTRITVQALDAAGKEIEFEAEDFFARVIQHECDHLAGKLFIDRISSLKRGLYKKKLKKILAEREDAARKRKGER
ncbi:Peptide deformylase [hydrothermal vent metagenome]|uniref:Peptide deformylase n=1 Tax=hydrothermal vent metagenome TaxID=652676 RepID=A0A3B0V646_9ZZZZ